MRFFRGFEERIYETYIQGEMADWHNICSDKIYIFVEYELLIIGYRFFSCTKTKGHEPNRLGDELGETNKYF